MSTWMKKPDVSAESARMPATQNGKGSDGPSFVVWFSRKLDIPHLPRFKENLQRQANRLMVGHCQYGLPSVEKKFMTRLAMELKAYRKTGNSEHLNNIQVYAYLEQITPENKKFHTDNTVGSVTRGRI